MPTSFDDSQTDFGEIQMKSTILRKNVYIYIYVYIMILLRRKITIQTFFQRNSLHVSKNSEGMYFVCKHRIELTCEDEKLDEI